MKDLLVEEIRIAAVPDLVYRAWTDKTLITAWWCNADFRTTHWEGRVHAGGHWLVRFEDTQGNLFSAQGQYLRADRPAILKFSWKPDWDSDPPTTIELQFRSLQDSTALRLTQSGLISAAAVDINKRAWAATVSMLRQYLEGSRVAPVA